MGTVEHKSIASPGHRRTSLNAAVLIGGASRRMGQPKATLLHDGRRLIDRAIQLAESFADAVFLVGRMPEGVTLESVHGAGRLPVSHLSDDPTAAGPLAGILAALAHDPQADWLCLSCDMPGLTCEAIDWLLSEYDPSRMATVGRIPDDGAPAQKPPGCSAPEPFPAIYRATALAPLRAYVQTGGASLRGALAVLNAAARSVPMHLVPCWGNVNTPADWERFLGS